MKFSIRELMVFTLAVLLGVGWIAERAALNNALDSARERAQEAEKQAKAIKELNGILDVQWKASEAHATQLEEHLGQIEKQLPPLGMELWPQDTDKTGPVVKRRLPAY